MNRYAFDLTCPRCGGEMEHRHSIRLSPSTSESETWCPECEVVWAVQVHARVVCDIHALVGDFERSARVRAGTAIDNESVRVFE